MSTISNRSGARRPPIGSFADAIIKNPASASAPPLFGWAQSREARAAAADYARTRGHDLDIGKLYAQFERYAGSRPRDQGLVQEFMLAMRSYLKSQDVIIEPLAWLQLKVALVTYAPPAP